MRKIIELKIVATLLLCFIFGQILSQIGEGGTPYFLENSNDINIETFKLRSELNLSGFLDNPMVDLIDGKELKTDENIIGRLFDVSLNIKNSGTWTELLTGDKIWRMKITSKYGSEIMLMFNKFKLSTGCEMFVYSTDRKKILGGYTKKSNRKSGRFTISPIKSKSVIVELLVPKYSSLPELEISNIGLIGEYLDLGFREFGESADCMINAKCPEFSGDCNNRRSVALVLIPDLVTGKISSCSGVLLTNERRDGRPYFLSAFHCLKKSTVLSDIEKENMENWIFVFNYQSASCQNPLIEPSQSESIIGATFVDGNFSKTDYLIMELNRRPPPDYNVFYAGWTNIFYDMTETGICFHHPRGDIKKVSKSEKVFTFAQYFWKVKWRIVSGKRSSVEDGSSGAPLFNVHGKCVGQLSIAKSGCDKGNKAYFGRFSNSWDLGLNEVLNPNENVWGIGSMSGDETCKLNWSFQDVDDLHTSSNVSYLLPESVGTRMYDGVYNAKNTITAENVTIKEGTQVSFIAGDNIQLKPGFIVELGASFSASIGACLLGCGNGRFLTGEELQGTDDMVLTKRDSGTLVKTTIPSNEELKIEVFPNPTNGIFELRVNNRRENLEFKIVNILGEVIKKGAVLEHKVIDLTKHRAGVYFVLFKTNRGALIKKIIKK